MVKNNTIIRDYFNNLGLSEEVADIYTALYTYGAQTISELSRHSGVERTRIYRMLETLKQTKLIIVEVHYKREILRAAPITNLQLLVNQKEHELVTLKTGLPEIYSLLSEYEQGQLPTRARFYKGDEGIKQMIWNETKAKSEVRCIIHNNLQHKFGLNYFTSWVRECNRRNVRFRGIVSDQFISDQKQWYKKYQSERLASWTERYIDPSIFPITHSTIIFDNVVNFYNWNNNREIYGIEIYGQEIAQTQEKLFDLLWEKAMPSKHILDRE